jgi:hypothetical protein
VPSTGPTKQEELLLNQGVWDPDADATGFRLMFSGSSAEVPTMLQKKTDNTTFEVADAQSF